MVAVAQSCNTADRTIELFLDASGSMNAKLPNGETRFAVAQRAIKGVASFIPAEARLSLRMYGAQSPTKAKNCEDTHLAVPFAAAGTRAGCLNAHWFLSVADAKKKMEDWRKYNEEPPSGDRQQAADHAAESRWRSEPAILTEPENSTRRRFKLRPQSTKNVQ